MLIRYVVAGVIFIAGATAVPAALASAPEASATSSARHASGRAGTSELGDKAAWAPSLKPDLDLANSNNCMSCHQIDLRSVGPSFRMVAARYRGHQDVVQKLATKIRIGGAGDWGLIPMPPNPAVTDAEARKLAEWILAQ